MAKSTFSHTLKRSIQLDALAYALVIGLLIITAVLGFMVFNSVNPPANWILADEWVQLAGLAFIGGFIIYLLDGHARLRKELEQSHQLLEDSQAETQRIFRGLLAAHNAAELMVGSASGDSMQEVAEEIREACEVDAVAVVGERQVLAVAPGIDRDVATDDMTRTAADVVRTGAPIAAERSADGSNTLAVPLRVLGNLRGVLCIWQQTGSLKAEELEGLTLAARIVELGWESQILFDGVEDRLEGTVSVIEQLIEQKLPGYTDRTAEIRRIAIAVGAHMGMSARELADLEVAVELRDLGILKDVCPDDIEVFGNGRDRRARTSHPMDGAELASVGHFSPAVWQAILCHHENPDGSGFPVHANGVRIPLSARIMRACEAFVELTSTYTDTAASAERALHTMQRGASTTFDADVLTAMSAVLGAAGSPEPALVGGRIA